MGKRHATPFEAPPFNREGNRKARRKAEAQRIVTLGMLLGAEWDGACFCRTVWGENTQDPYRKYWDKDGNAISSMQASKLTKSWYVPARPTGSKSAFRSYHAR